MSGRWVHFARGLDGLHDFVEIAERLDDQRIDALIQR
jgi:hypothetical protein